MNLDRYKRQLIIPDVGEMGQKKIESAKVLLIGAGGLGSPIAYYLVAAGIGTIGILDFDVVDVSNLQRQILHNEENINVLKVKSAKEKLEKLNPNTTINTYNILVEDNEDIRTIIEQYNVIVLAVDNIETRYIVNKICCEKNKFLVDGGIENFSGYVWTIYPGESACYNCVFPENRMSFEKHTIGVIGALPGIIGSLQAMETLKYIIGKATICNKILYYNGLKGEFKTRFVDKDINCSHCREIK